MSITTRFEVYTRTGKRKATIQRVFAIATLGLLVLSLAMLAMPVSASGAEPTRPGGDPSNGTSPLDGPEFYVAKHGIEAQAHLQEAQPDGDPSSGTSPVDGPEFWVAKYGTAAQAHLQEAQPDGDPASGTSPLDGPEFYVARHGAEPAGCKTWSDALAQFHMVKPLSDPANGAWSPAQAQFFVAQYGTDGALTVFHEENDQAFLCQA
jgi:hypothetical protein